MILILVFGGAYQGMLEYVLERFGRANSEIYYCNDETEVIPDGEKIVFEFDKWILALVKSDIDAENAVKRFIAGNKGAVVICNDISCGVVPADPVMRKWREETGRALAALSKASDEVVRLFCGIPCKIK